VEQIVQLDYEVQMEIRLHDEKIIFERDLKEHMENFVET